MKIEQIDLKAYGHFSQQRISLAGQAALHIICGPNEAGKTTLWRAINGALFGIPEQTRDGFLHTNPKLRVGLALSAPDGSRLAIMRRKGRLNTLLAYDPANGIESQESVPEERLRKWLGGLSQTLFLAMFSLDHDALVRGGEALAQGKGDAGESLFEAGAGLSSIRALRARLDREAELLFKPRASTSSLYKAMADYEELRRQAREASIRPADWTAAQSAMEAARGAHQAALAEQSRLLSEARRLERFADHLPDVAALGLAKSRRLELSGVPELPPSASSERIAATTQASQAAEAERLARARLEQHRRELQSLATQVDERILAEAESIEALHHAATAYREATLQAAASEAAIDAARRAFDSARQQLSGALAPEDTTASWRVDTTLLARIGALTSSGARLLARHEADLKHRDARMLVTEQLESELQTLAPDASALALAAYLDAIADHGDPEARARQLALEVAAWESGLQREALALKLSTVAEVTAGAVPLDPTLQAFKTRDEELRGQERSIRDAIRTMEDHLATLQTEIRRLEVRGDVPSRDTVIAQRTQRDALWAAIRRHLAGTPVEGVVATPPAAPYELAVTSADEAADALFSDAERATRHAECRVREDQLIHALQLEHGRAEDVRTAQTALRQQWDALLAAHRLPDLTIAEVEPWLMRRAALMQRIEAMTERRDAVARDRELAHAIRTRLADLLRQTGIKPPDDTAGLSEILAHARLIATQRADQRTQRKLKESALVAALVEKSHALRSEAESRTALASWQAEWAQAMQQIRLDPHASPEEAAARIEQLAALEQARSALDAARVEGKRAQLRIRDFTQRVAEIWQLVRGAPLPAGESRHEILAAELYRELDDARARQQRKATLSQQLLDDQLAVDNAEGSGRAAGKALEKLMAQAGCASLEALEVLEGQSALRAELIARIRDIEERLVRSFGMPLAEVLAQSAGLAPDAVADALQRTAQASRDNAEQVQACHEHFLACRQAFERMDGSAAAADAQQGLAQQVARLAELSADYSASRLASAILAQVIDTYQKRNQGPLIGRASKHFASITSERYCGVVIDYDEDRQILKAVRHDGERLAMEQLSTGRRDQLYLAMRLAAIEGHLDSGEALPVIVDDILIQFDDAAAAATFRVLAALSQRTQILFLTHHQHLLEVAESAIGPDAFRAHRLSA